VAGEGGACRVESSEAIASENLDLGEKVLHRKPRGSNSMETLLLLVN
jgi:hypothetical protein